MRLLGKLACLSRRPARKETSSDAAEPAERQDTATEDWAAADAAAAADDFHKQGAEQQAANAIASAAQLDSPSHALVSSAYVKLAGNSLPSDTPRASILAPQRRRLSDGLTSSHAPPDDVLDAMCMLACSVLKVAGAGELCQAMTHSSALCVGLTYACSCAGIFAYHAGCLGLKACHATEGRTEGCKAFFVTLSIGRDPTDMEIEDVQTDAK